MSQSISEFITELHRRKDLRWPQPPPLQPLKATPAAAPLPGIRVVTLNPYGSLLHIDQGKLFHLHPQQLRTQIALEKTIQEFNMWNSMSRKPGQPWEYMLQQYKKLLEEREMASTHRKGDFPAVDSAQIWKKELERLVKNEYVYDVAKLGDLSELGLKVAYFFHANMQGVAAHAHAREVLMELTARGVQVGLLGDGQRFTLMQVLEALRAQGPVQSPGEVLAADCIVLSAEVGVRQPSPGLYEAARDRFRSRGIPPEAVLHVTHRLDDDLAQAKAVGFRTALFAADKPSCPVSQEALRDPERKPDRLLTELRQLTGVVMR
jgi:FMN phosphatase YigB (HAD superfamily)